MAEFDPEAQGFIPHDIETLATKISQFALDGVSKLHVVSDWDRTLTANGGKSDITSWEVAQRMLPPEGRKQDQLFSDYYYARELDGTLTEQDAREWWRISLGLQVEHQTNIHDMQRAVREARMRPRAGAVALFRLCNELEIPTVILSAGVKNVIEWVTEANDMHPSHILATSLKLDPDGRITGWEDSTLTHALNKNEMGHREITTVQRSRPNTILLGDDKKDPRMVNGQNRVLRFQVQDGRLTKRDRKESQEAGYDALISGALFPVESLIRWINNPL